MPSTFESLVGELDYPMYVVTASDGSERSGCLVGFLTQCSIDPPRVLVCLSKQNRTATVAQGSPALVVHVLHESDHPLAQHFGERSGDEVDKFADVAWFPSDHGVPVLMGLDWFLGEVLAVDDLGDHLGVLLAVTREGFAARTSEPQLGFQAVRDLDPGHPASND